jgi:hypothetical protein
MHRLIALIERACRVTRRLAALVAALEAALVALRVVLDAAGEVAAA